MAQGWWAAIDPSSEGGVPESSASAKRKLLRVLLAGDTKRGDVHGEQALHEVLNGHQRSKTTHSEPRFRTLLTEEASDVELALIRVRRTYPAHGSAYKRCPRSYWVERSRPNRVRNCSTVLSARASICSASGIGNTPSSRRTC